MYFRSSKNETLRKWLGFYLIFSSLTGIYACWNAYTQVSQHALLLWAVFVFGILYILIGTAGISLLQSSRYVILAMGLQALQLVGFSLGYKYVFSAGTSIKIGYQSQEILFMIEPVNGEFVLGKHVPDEFFYVNIIPFVTILLLNRVLLSRQEGENKSAQAQREVRQLHHD